jgi:hypothetical protein
LETASPLRRRSLVDGWFWASHCCWSPGSCCSCDSPRTGQHPLAGGRRARTGRLPPASTPAERRLKHGCGLRTAAVDACMSRPDEALGTALGQDHHHGNDSLHRQALVSHSGPWRLPSPERSRASPLSDPEKRSSRDAHFPRSAGIQAGHREGVSPKESGSRMLGGQAFAGRLDWARGRSTDGQCRHRRRRPTGNG